MIGKLPENRNTILSLINQTGRLGVIIYSFLSTMVSFCYIDEWGKQFLCVGGGRGWTTETETGGEGENLDVCITCTPDAIHFNL